MRVFSVCLFYTVMAVNMRTEEMALRTGSGLAPTDDVPATNPGRIAVDSTPETVVTPNEQADNVPAGVRPRRRRKRFDELTMNDIKTWPRQELQHYWKDMNKLSQRKKYALLDRMNEIDPPEGMTESIDKMAPEKVLRLREENYAYYFQALRKLPSELRKKVIDNASAYQQKMATPHPNEVTKNMEDSVKKNPETWKPWDGTHFRELPDIPRRKKMSDASLTRLPQAITQNVADARAPRPQHQESLPRQEGVLAQDGTTDEIVSDLLKNLDMEHVMRTP
jgi:hypothetical protein